MVSHRPPFALAVYIRPTFTYHTFARFTGSSGRGALQRTTRKGFPEKSGQSAPRFTSAVFKRGASGAFACPA
jgi:hypothetical protein